MIDVLYFAWVRERIGLPKERLETTAPTVAALVDELRAAGLLDPVDNEMIEDALGQHEKPGSASDGIASDGLKKV